MARPEERDFAGFRIVRPLELGERASVWEAEDPETGEPVAIETLAGEAARDEVVSEWFAEAWELAAEIEGRGVVRVLEVGEQEGVPFAVRAPAGEMTLADRLEGGGPLAPGAALQVLTDVAEALETAHHGGVVHGDLGPGAVVLDEQGRAYLAGFGRREGDRREDVRLLGELLVDMLGAAPEDGEEAEETETDAAVEADDEDADRGDEAADDAGAEGDDEAESDAEAEDDEDETPPRSSPSTSSLTPRCSARSVRRAPAASSLAPPSCSRRPRPPSRRTRPASSEEATAVPTSSSSPRWPSSSS